MDNVYIVHKCYSYYTDGLKRHLKEDDEISGIFSTVEKATEALGIEVEQILPTTWSTKEVINEDVVTVYYVINQVKFDQVINK